MLCNYITQRATIRSQIIRHKTSTDLVWVFMGS